MDNLDQIRADNAIRAAGQVEKKSVTKLPALIVNNGLLATAAFCRDKGEGLLTAMNAVADHLLDKRIAKVSALSNRRPQDYRGSIDDLLHDLTASPSSKLRMAADEALAYLSYLKRFAP